MKECIILAGGLGTRLRSVVPELPKCMAPVDGKPFISYILDHLEKEGIEKFIFSVGYKYEIIENFLRQQRQGLHYQLSIENEPLGTGGAIKLACAGVTEKSVIIVNGDTLFRINVERLIESHHEFNADCTLCLKPMHKFDRYGVVELNTYNSVKSFKEKKFYENGLINGGVYALNIAGFLKTDLPQKFSFETNYLEKSQGGTKLFGIVQDKYFIDIGIPEDYKKAQRELAG